MQRELLRRKTQADTALERAALTLEALVKEACEELRPFPPFPNALFTHAIELDPGPVANPDIGCVVVMEDGEICELEFGIDHEAIELSGSWDPVTARSEKKKALELHPLEYIVYAYDAIEKVTELLLEQAENSEEPG
ncbi:MAG: hypothetical protein R3C29_01925 [Dehalococcoidia bacterium]